jgi:hypothetical protein
MAGVRFDTQRDIEMTDEFRTTLSEELSSLTPPPLGDLVGQAARRGRRARRVRMITATAGSVAAVATVAALLAGTMGSGARPAVELAGPAAAVAGSASPSTAGNPSPNPSTSADAPASTHPSSGASAGTGASTRPGPGADLQPATPEALVMAVVNAMPKQGTVGPYAVGASDPGSQPGDLAVQVYQTDSRGTSMVRVFTSKSPMNCVTEQCETNSHGVQYRVLHEAGNCIQSSVISVEHADGTLVTVQQSTCLAWTGSANPKSFEMLTEDQAAQLAADPAISTRMSPDTLAQGAALYGGKLGSFS